MSCIDPPQLLTDALDLKAPILTPRKLTPIQRKACLDHFGRQVCSVVQTAGRDRSFVRYAAVGYGSDNLPLAHRHQRPLGILAVRLVEFGRIDARKPNVDLVDDDGVAINHPAVTLDDLLAKLFIYVAERLLRLGWCVPRGRRHWPRNWRRNRGRRRG